MGRTLNLGTGHQSSCPGQRPGGWHWLETTRESQKAAAIQYADPRNGRIDLESFETLQVCILGRETEKQN